jgi:hypothetical protein
MILAHVTVTSNGFPGFVTAGSRGSNEVMMAGSLLFSPLPSSVGWPLASLLHINVFHEFEKMASSGFT